MEMASSRQKKARVTRSGGVEKKVQLRCEVRVHPQDVQHQTHLSHPCLLTSCEIRTSAPLKKHLTPHSRYTHQLYINYTWTRFTHFTETKLTHSPLVIHRFDPVPLHFFNIVLQEGVVVFKCQGSPWKTDRRNLTMTTLPLCPKVWCTRHLCFTEENRDW